MTLNDLTIDGMLYPNEALGPISVKNPTVYNAKYSNKEMFNGNVNNSNGVIGSFLLYNAYKKVPTYKTDLSTFIDYFFNPFMDGYEVMYLENFKTILNDNSLETRYTKYNDSLYATYSFNDLKKATDKIKEIEAQYPELTFVFPFKGSGSASFMFEFDKYGYLLSINANIDSDDLTISLGRSSVSAENIIYSGKLKGSLKVTNKVTLYEENEIPIISFKELDNEGKEKSTVTYIHRGPKDENEWNGIGEEYYSKAYQVLAPYFNYLLPGYGSNIIIEKKQTEIDNIYIDLAGKRTSIKDTSLNNFVDIKYLSDVTCVYLKPKFFELVNTNFSLDVLLK